MPEPACGQAPGRLDFLGGVADYSGSLVLQMPIRATTRVTISSLPEPILRVSSKQQSPVEWPMGGLENIGDVPQWSCYVLGSLQLFCDAMQWQPAGGLSFEVESDVPMSMGVSSSAALEVATIRALENFSGRRFSGTELAQLAQRVENEIVGAPCGLMDQLASAHGAPDSLLPILCRPDVLLEPIPLPAGVFIAGWPSGVRHAVAGSPYATARCAAFMGKKILERQLGRKVQFLSEFSPPQAGGVDGSTLPSELRGADFLETYGGVEDALSVVEVNRAYPVRAATLFPIEENSRCESVRQLLLSIDETNRAGVLQSVGDMMYLSHAGYSAMGLGTPQTDEMVETIRARGVEQGFYGARVSGGGAGGTVAVLLEKSAWSDLQQLAGGALII